MILTSIEELRLYFPNHAIDHIEAFVGYIDNSEHDFLLEPLGQPLYDKLCEHYDAHRHEYSSVDSAVHNCDTTTSLSYYNRLLLMAQRCVAFDAMGRALDMQAVSINNAGLNFSSADDYKTADRDAKNDAKAACLKEAHASLNRLLCTLENWVQQAPTKEEARKEDEELFEIATFWKQSRYYYLAAQMLIPSARMMQEYLNIYDSREKFIQMLPDLRFIQEEQIAPAIGEDFLDYLIEYALRNDIPAGTDAASRQPSTVNSEQPSSRLFDRIVHRLRKIQATFLEDRTTVLRIDKERKIRAHDEAVMLLGRICEYVKSSQGAILTALADDADIFERSPLYQKPAPATPEKQAHHCGCDGHDGEFKNNTPEAGLFLTPPLL